MATAADTRPSAIDLRLADALIEQAIDMLRFAAGMNRTVARRLNSLEDELLKEWNNSSAATQGRARQRFLREAAELIDDAYDDIANITDEQLAGAAQVVAASTAGALYAAYADGLPDPMPIRVVLGAAAEVPSDIEKVALTTLIEGAPSREWWTVRQAGDTAFRFAAAVRQGVAHGMTREQIARRITGDETVQGVLNLSRVNARRLVTQSAVAVSAAARMATFEANDDVLKGYQQVSTLDARTSQTCIAYAGAKWNRKKQPVAPNALPFVSPNGSASGCPRHWNCRAVIVAWTKTYRELGIDIDEVDENEGEQAASGGPVPASWTFDDWINSKSAAYQDQLLGKGMADLYRRGVITRQQLLDAKGNELTLAQLRAKYDR